MGINFPTNWEWDLDKLQVIDFGCLDGVEIFFKNDMLKKDSCRRKPLSCHVLMKKFLNFIDNEEHKNRVVHSNSSNLEKEQRLTFKSKRNL